MKAKEKKVTLEQFKKYISGPKMAQYLRQIADAIETSEKLFKAKLDIEVAERLSAEAKKGNGNG